MSDIYQGIDADGLVTGEAVTLDLPPASLGLRVASGVIDVFAELVLLVVGLLVILPFASDQATASVVVIVVVVGSLVLLPASIETFTRGRSLGKLVLGTRTVRTDAGPITFRHALIRALVGVVEVLGFSGVPAIIAAMATAKGQRVGDLVAGTYVVRDRMALTLPLPATMPPPLAAWARSADVAPMPAGLAIRVRQLVGRADTLSPEARHRLLARTADEVLRYVAPPPPPGTPPHAFLAAVQVERRERDSRRLGREAELRARLARR